MKRILKLAALAVLGMMIASCSKNAAPEEGVPVSISVQAPEIGTKSISDGIHPYALHQNGTQPYSF